MTVWDSMALNAPHTEREIRSIHETGAGDLPTKLDGFPLLEEAIKEHFGQRCDEYMAGCPCCDTWAELDRLRAIRAAEARELAQDGETAPGSATEPESATCPAEGGFGGRPEHRLIAAAREALEIVKAGNLEPMETDGLVCAIHLGDVTDLYESDGIAPIDIGGAPPRAAILSAIAAEKAEWPHAGSMHDGARMACDAIAERVKKLMGGA